MTVCGTTLRMPPTKLLKVAEQFVRASCPADHEYDERVGESLEEYRRLTMSGTRAATSGFRAENLAKSVLGGSEEERKYRPKQARTPRAG
jgi:hypothetical protein